MRHAKDYIIYSTNLCSRVPTEKGVVVRHEESQPFPRTMYDPGATKSLRHKGPGLLGLGGSPPALRSRGAAGDGGISLGALCHLSTGGPRRLTARHTKRAQ